METAELSTLPRKLRWKAGQASIPLLELPVGVKASVVRIDPSDPQRLDRLASLGVLPGATIRLIRNRGVYLAILDSYQVAFDRAIAEAVWVKISPPAAGGAPGSPREAAPRAPRRS
jgi:Fe2+ transport system protein FeoA